MLKFIISRLKTASPLQYLLTFIVFTLLVFVVKFYGIRPDHRLIRVEIFSETGANAYSPYSLRTPYWLSNRIQTGQTERDASGNIIAEVVNVENYIRTDEDARLYLTLKVAAVQNSRTLRYTFKDQPLDLGSPIDLNLNTIALMGRVIDDNVPQNGYPSKQITIRARARNLTPAIYSQIVPGLKMYERAANSVIAEITAVDLVEAEKQSFQIDRRNYITAGRNIEKDALITVKIKVQQIDNRWYFGGQSLIMVNNGDYPISIFTDKIYLSSLEVEAVDGL